VTALPNPIAANHRLSLGRVTIAESRRTRRLSLSTSQNSQDSEHTERSTQLFSKKLNGFHHVFQFAEQTSFKLMYFL
jgi:hypothetical protein